MTPRPGARPGFGLLVLAIDRVTDGVSVALAVLLLLPGASSVTLDGAATVAVLARLPVAAEEIVPWMVYVAVAPDGELYVCDGYGNARVHRFKADGTLIQSWGEPGVGPGQFHLPHGIGVAPDNRVFVTDRENDRIHIYTRDGQLLDTWTHVQRPTDISFGKDGLVYVSELWWRVGQSSFVHGEIKWDLPGRVSIFDLQGNVITRWGGADREAPGYFVAPHTICIDSRGDMYVGEVTWTFGVSRGGVREDAHTFQKFARF